MTYTQRSPPKTTSRRATASSRCRRPATRSSSSTAPSADAAAHAAPLAPARTTFASAAPRRAAARRRGPRGATSRTSSSDRFAPRRSLAVRARRDATQLSRVLALAASASAFAARARAPRARAAVTTPTPRSSATVSRSRRAARPPSERVVEDGGDRARFRLRLRRLHARASRRAPRSRRRDDAGAHVAARSSQAPDVEVREHEGASWASLHERSLELSFVSPAESKAEGGVVVEARVRGGAAKSALRVPQRQADRHRSPLVKGEAKSSRRTPRAASIRAARTSFSCAFVGGARATRDNLAEIDWIRVGPTDGDAPYSAPTRATRSPRSSIGGVARRGVSLRAPGSVRCAGFVPNGAVLEGSDRRERRRGRGRGARARRSRGAARGRQLPPRRRRRAGVAARSRSRSATSARSPPWSSSRRSSTKGARVVFAEPRVVATRTPAETVRRRPRRAASSWSCSARSPPKIALALRRRRPRRPSSRSSRRRAPSSKRIARPTSFASGALALDAHRPPPREHGVSEPDASLGATGVTIAEAARQAGVVTAMFTANPDHDRALWFARGWETFTARSPGEDAPATAVFDDVEHWLDGTRTIASSSSCMRAAVIRPWDVTSDEMKDLAPAGYTGSLDAEARRRDAREGAAQTAAQALHATPIASARSRSTRRRCSRTTPRSARSSPTCARSVARRTRRGS